MKRLQVIGSWMSDGRVMGGIVIKINFTKKPVLGI